MIREGFYVPKDYECLTQQELDLVELSLERIMEDAREPSQVIEAAKSLSLFRYYRKNTKKPDAIDPRG